MQLHFPTILAQFDYIGGLLGVLAAIVVSFLTIMLISSYYRFQHIVQLAEEKSPEEMGVSASEVLRVQLARYLAGCARRGTAFSMALIKTGSPAFHGRMDSDAIAVIRQAVRRDDVVCVYDQETAVLLAESEPEDAETILTRVLGVMASAVADFVPHSARIGIASYPGHGLKGQNLIDVALEGLEQTTVERPVVLPEIIDADEDESDSAIPEEIEADSDAEPDGKGRGWRERRKDAILDPVTGVLKPSVISTYMLRMMGDIRYKKQKAALFCIGVNNMDHIARFHGEVSADDVMAGISGILQKHMRSGDLIGRHEKHAFLVLAKCSLEEAEGIGKRISTLVQQAQFASSHKKLKTTITLGVSAYPEHGRNLHQLYQASQKVLDHSRTNDIRAYAVYDPEIHDKMQAKPMRSIKSVKA